uniref:Cyclic GMP-AMP synthase n=1 Tax=Sciurus vulgaris TaxID=55149 RepID=A0A8D2B5L5_SCIVU
MESQRGKATRTASKAGAATRKVSERSTRVAVTEPRESPAAPRAAQLNVGKCGSVRESRSLQTQSARDSQEELQERALGARSKKASLRAQGAPPSGVSSTDGAEAPKPPVAPRPLPTRARSRREGGARSAREQRPAPELAEVPCSVTPARVPSLGVRERVPGGWKPRAVLDKLRLRRQEISAAAEVVNRVVDHLLRRLQDFDSEFKGVQLLRTGSYYERVKISAPNEFDVMFKLEVPRIQLEEYCSSGAHYFVKFKRNPKGNPLKQFVEEEILSASKMLSKFRKLIKEDIKNIEGIDVVMEKKKRGSPAVTLCIRKPEEISVDIILALESKSSWPASTQEGLPIDNWLGAKVRKKLRQQPFYLVPKHAKNGSGFQEQTWRLSFSHIEKDILNNHGHSKTCCENDGVKCCRKDCLKLMKYLLEQLKKKFDNRKELDKFCSYHLKTAFLHVCTQDPLDSQWHPKDLVFCFDNCVAFFLKCLRKEQLEHYFVPIVNLFSRKYIDKISKEFLSEQIEYERNNGFPIFNEF